MNKPKTPLLRTVRVLLRRQLLFANRYDAFTRLELLTVIAVLGLFGVFLVPALANTRQKTGHAVCINNLRQIGRAYHVWGQDRANRHPASTATNLGGLQGQTVAANAWYHFACLSNELATPRVLVCPADAGRKTALDFSASLEGGLVNPGYRNNAASYFVGVDAVFALPASFLAGDRNIRWSGKSQCGAINLANLWTLYTRPVILNIWTNNIHGTWGNVLCSDGRVQVMANPVPPETLGGADDNGTVHSVVP